LISIKAAEINFRYWHAWSPQGNDRVGYYMTVLGNIISTIFGHAGAKPAPTSPGTGPAAPQPAVDIDAVLTKVAGQNKEKLDWRRSIVDLLKLRREYDPCGLMISAAVPMSKMIAKREVGSV
jgi:hypothetical protein